MQYFLRVITTFLLILTSLSIQAQLYQSDPLFQPLQVKRNDGFVHQLIIQPDQKILIRGGYHFINGKQTESFNRLLADGNVDQSFHPSSEVFTPLWVALRKDNKIVAGNIYSRPNGKNGITVFLLQPDGKLDSTFHTNIETGTVSSTEAFAVHSDNSIVVGALFFDENTYKTAIHRIYPDGSTATLYKNAIGNSWISSLQFQPDGKVLATGVFPMEDGSIKSLLRLHANGGIDDTFQALQLPAYLYPPTVSLLPDGKMLIGQYGSTLTRLNADGSVDTSFQMNPGDWNRVDRIVLQPDGKLLLSVWMDDKVNYWFGYSKVVRINTDGTLDTAFNCGQGAADYEIDLMVLQANGDIMLGGLFKTFNGQTKVALARLKGNNGALDTSFQTKLESNGHLDPVLLQPDGKLLVAGSFDLVNDQVKSHIARLNSNGTVDTTFRIGTGVDGFWDINGGVINAMALQPDKKIIVGGNFTSFNGHLSNSLLRLKPDGTVDSSFVPAITEQYIVTAILLQADGKIVIGAASPYNREFTKLLFRLNSNGSLDPSFKADIDFNPSITRMVAQKDGKLVIAGYTTSSTGEVFQVITRLLADGKTDPTFKTSKASGGFFNPISSIVVQEDGKIIIGGGLTSFNNTPASKLVRLQADGTIDPTFTSSIPANSEISSIIVRKDGRILIGGNFFNFGNRSLNQLSSNGELERTLFLSEEVYIYRLALLEVGNDLLLSGGSRAIRLTRLLTEQTINFDPIPNQHPEAAPFVITVSANSNLPVSLQVVEGPATLSGNKVKLTGETGKVTIRASQGGNDFYKPALEVERSFFVDAVLGIDSRLSQLVTLFPNPAQEEFLVRLPQSLQMSNIQIFNSQGSLMKATHINTPDGILFKTDHLLKGIYLVQIHLSGQVINKKVLIN